MNMVVSIFVLVVCLVFSYVVDDMTRAVLTIPTAERPRPSRIFTSQGSIASKVAQERHVGIEIFVDPTSSSGSFASYFRWATSFISTIQKNYNVMSTTSRGTMYKLTNISDIVDYLFSAVKKSTVLCL